MAKMIDITGQRFNRLLVLERDIEDPRKGVYWKCQCDCGNFVTVRSADIRSGNTNSCGCYKRDRTKEYFTKPIVGKTFGRLTVIESLEERRGRKRVLLTKCECGNFSKVTYSDLVTGNTQSCGCMVSKGEALIARILSENDIEFKKQYTFPNLISPNGGSLRFDFGILVDGELDYLLEYDGIQHFKWEENGWITKDKFDIGRGNDMLKNEYCENNNIKLVRIKYNDEISLQSIKGVF